MIQEIEKNGTKKYKVRVFVRSTKNPNLRITRQVGEIASIHEAQKEEQKLRKECERELLALELRGVLFFELMDEWQEHMIKTKVKAGSRSMTSQLDYYGTLRKWFSSLKSTPAGEITPYKISEIFNQMTEKGICFGHRKRIKQTLKSIFDYGIGSGLIKTMQKSPTFEITLGKANEKKPEILTLQEIQTLIALAYRQDHPWKRIWHVALLTGARSGELNALLKTDIDFENKLLNVNKSHNSNSNSIKSTKAGYWRQIPISKELEAVLREQIKETPESDFVFSRFWMWDKGLQARILRNFCYINGLPSVRFHTLRACFATQMLRIGVEPAKVMKVCGWKELKTMQHYVRLAGIEIQGVTEAMQIFSDTPKEIEPLPDITRHNETLTQNGHTIF